VKFARASWTVVVYTVLTILWGAYVRATGSGAGCGRHWPLCNGEVVPQSPGTAMIIEFSHRASAGLSVVFVVALCVFAFRTHPKGDKVRKTAFASVFFALGEALVGALLVLYELVAHDTSMKRGVSSALHLVNTFFLVGALTLTAYFASGGAGIRLRKQGALPWIVLAVLGGMLLLGTSGAVTALGETLFPPRSLAEGFAQDLSPTAHLFLRLRVFHPMIAASVGAGVLGLATAGPLARPNDVTRMAGRAALVLYLAQFGLGLANVALLAPVWMQMLHLLFADLTWIALVVLSASLLSDRPNPSTVR
jgi:heme A synthase